MNRNFNQQDFESLIKEFLDESNIKGISNRTKIAKLRQYCEVVVRKILDFPNNQKLTLGDKAVVKKLRAISNNNILLMNSIDFIRSKGNDCIHTKNPKESNSDDDLNQCMEHLLNIYAYLFIAYFEKCRFGTNNEVLSLFSLLPPILRHIVLDYLFIQDNENLSVIDKLSLAKLKEFNQDTAIDWLDENKAHLINLSSVSDDGFTALAEKCGMHIALEIKQNAPNMYDLCYNRIQKVSNILETEGKLYKTFEEALPIFLKEKENVHKTNEIIEFLDIMDFIYLQRNPVDNNQLERLPSYQTMIFKG
ncbi:hypothetical protein LP122_10195 [Moraxella bovis]|uniref:hypothetical protein n=1 Tax=Moraxella bovis TaxID=476 RepID=UPI0022273F23|nr:hypothetical protein [Moraxella bovis]UYZ68122.1 hypothetical protein LP122_10195 [Moraxella bovis]UZA27843.1 hypothetical protein LP119_02355 [Moraxella bovis]UZA37613.1 hypothetical protein LP101_10675 [Moraxella bovis]WAJ74039.1 hypothetical protein LP095_02355 [Moraxella bovis]